MNSMRDKMLDPNSVSEIYLHKKLSDVRKKFKQREAICSDEVELLESVLKSAESFESGDYTPCPIFKPNEAYLTIVRVVNSRKIPLMGVISSLQSVLDSPENVNDTWELGEAFANELINMLTQDIYKANNVNRLGDVGYGRQYRY